MNKTHERQIFIAVFIINFCFFLVEIVAGWLGHSMGLVADSLDMLADAIIFGVTIFIIGKAPIYKKRIAKVSGYFQFALAFLGLVEVVRRFLSDTKTPDYKTMIFISLFALAGNALSLYMIKKAKSKDQIHIKAGTIFLSNDVIINFGVIIAGILVLITQSKFPDLIIGTIVFVIVARGAYRILKL